MWPPRSVVVAGLVQVWSLAVGMWEALGVPESDAFGEASWRLHGPWLRRQEPRAAPTSPPTLALNPSSEQLF
jgi:hypothetical protein